MKSILNVVINEICGFKVYILIKNKYISYFVILVNDLIKVLKS